MQKEESTPPSSTITAEEYHTLLSSFTQAFWETDGQGMVIKDSPSWQAYTGQSREGGMGEGWVAAVHPDDQPYALSQWQEAGRQKKRVDAEFRLQRPGGGYRWTNVKATPILNPDGSIKKWLGINIDIQDKKDAEQALLEAQQYYEIQLEAQVYQRTQELEENRQLLRGTLDSTLEMIQVFKAVRNKQGEIIDFVWTLNNHASEKYYGHVIGKSLLEMNPGVKQMGVFETFKKVCETGVADQSERHYVHEQFNGWFYQSTVKLEDGLVTTTTDITKLKQTKHELATLKEHLQTILDSSPYIVQAFRAERDETGAIIDFIWMMNNERGIMQNGDVIGKSLLEKNPAVVDTGLFAQFVEVTETGKSIEQEKYYGYEQFDGWYHQVLIKMNDGFVMNTEDITEKKRSQQEILRLKDEIAKKATDRYYSLFNTIGEGLAVLEMIYDEKEKPLDLRWLEVNPAFEKITGLEKVAGKLASDFMPAQFYWLEAYDRVVKTGESIRYEHYDEDNHKWYQTHTSRIGGPESRVIANVFEDITERRHGEQLQEYLLKLSDALRSTTCPIEIRRKSVQLLGPQLQVDHAYFTTISDKERSTDAEYISEEGAELMSNFSASSFGAVMEVLLRGENFVMEEVRKTDRLSAEEKDSLIQSNIEASISVPLISEGSLIAVLTVDQRDPRQWTKNDIKILHETAERAWAAVQRAEVEDTLRRSEAKFRRLSESGLVSVAFFDIGGPIMEANEAFLTMLGVTKEELYSEKVRWDVYTHEDWIPRTWQAVEEFKQTGAIQPYEKQFYHSSGELRWGIFAGSVLEEGKTGVSLVIDITARKRAEEALRESEAHLAAIFESLPVAIGVVNTKGEFILSNKEMERFIPTGVMPSMDKDTPNRWLGYYPDGSRMDPQDFPGARALRGERVLPPIEMRYTQDDGSTIWTHVSAVPIKNGHEQATGHMVIISNINDLKQAEQDLQQSQTHLLAIFQTAQVGISELNTEGYFLRVNDKFCQLLARNASELIGHTISEVTFEEDIAKSYEVLQQLLLTGEVASVDKRYVKPDGTIVWANSSVSLLHHKASQDTTVLAITADLTQRKEAEMALQKLELRTRMAVEAADMATWEWDLQTNEVFWNEHHFRIFGLEPQIGPVHPNVFFEHVHPNDRGRVEELLRQALTGETDFDTEFCALREDGTERWMSGYGRVMEKSGGQPLLMSGVMLDITARRQAEIDLRHMKGRQDAMLKSATDYAILTLDLDLKVQDWNAGAEYMLGYSEPEIVGKPGEIFFVPEDRAEGAPEKERDMALLQGRAENERWHMRKDGTRFFGSGVTTPLLNEAGTIIGLLKVMRDLTSQKQAEDDLKEANQRKNEFLSMLAHELRNPMATLRSGLQILSITAATNAQAKTVIDRMTRQTDHLVRMVDDLLDVSRISQGKIELKKERVHLNDLVHQALESVQMLVEHKQQKLRVNIPIETIELEGDATRLVQLMMNLLTNASRYTPNHGAIELSLSQEENTAIIRVTDNGIGLATDQLSKIFELFVQVDHSLARSQGGLGLGLTLVKQIAELHEGSVEAQSEGLNKGSTFVVHLPALPRGRNEMDPSTKLTSIRQTSILIVDDNSDSSFTLSVLLELKGYEVYTRDSGMAALEALDILKPEVILLDIGMPEMDGYETCRQIRQHPRGPQTFIIAVSGYGQDSDKRKAREAGFDEHVTKPVDLEYLMQIIRHRSTF
ncbi:hypothetical protein BWI96_19310 [Siphonobacter sp. SORGH_AS_0500]|uniref:PAS domain S-box protein n=1 Tax=Siphonobacter sp. SORGH_AS_0500 TaxID=1864824 RepID=UPI000CC7D73F|nr:PAS domain S-box protein [Siphonobacter sp. SORGH_AS_0500]PKK34980.1 hypothetical protein BWI96_19310 [Siphonobacter sp. SORGH_AS_0500]